MTEQRRSDHQGQQHCVRDETPASERSRPRSNHALSTQCAQSRSLGMPAATGPVLISQQLLAEYQELKQQERRRKQLRSSIVAMLDLGAGIEPGDFTVRIEEGKSRRLNRRTLTAHLGEEAVEILLEEIEPTVQRRLLVSGEGPPHEGLAPRTDEPFLDAEE
jgi:hypothetical protein